MLPTRHYRAAGGIVLLIERDVERDGRMIHEIRLPKGKLDRGETDGEAALREVREETGYGDLEITADLGEARIEYDRNGKHTIRDEHYYLMRLTSDTYHGQDMTPGSEEDLFEPRWADDLDDARAKLSYVSEKQWIEVAQQALA
jgi:8-oxo-dGTP pyrophosphatase MutT (NUDIX family)